MGRMHSHGKGIARSALPYRRTPPQWCKTEPETVSNKKEIIIKMIYNYIEI